MEVIKSINYSQTDLIADIIKLHVPQGYIDCDCTYSKGQFYADGKVKDPIYKFDLSPQSNDVVMADSRSLPLNDKSINCLMFDPPFLATKGKSLEQNKGNVINRRFGVYPDEQSLHTFYVDSIKEAYRVLNDDGIFIFKCQDKVSSSKQYMSHVFICNMAVSNGFYPKDLFILLAKNRLVADWQAKNQKNARKFHCYFWVFQKTNKKIEYI